MTNIYTYQDRELLVIDDEPAIIRVVKRITNKDFKNISSAINFQEGKQAINNFNVPQSVILSDYHMPGGLGLDLAKISYETRKSLQIGMIIMSAAADSEDLNQIKAAEAEQIIDGFIEKPFSPADIKNAVQNFYQKIGLQI